MARYAVFFAGNSWVSMTCIQCFLQEIHGYLRRRCSVFCRKFMGIYDVYKIFFAENSWVSTTYIQYFLQEIHGYLRRVCSIFCRNNMGIYNVYTVFFAVNSSNIWSNVWRVYMRCLWQGFRQIYYHIRYIRRTYTVLANPTRFNVENTGHNPRWSP